MADRGHGVAMTATTPLAMLNFFDPAFHHHSEAVAAAREAHWYARTPLGFAVLRYAEAAELLRDRRLRQGAMEFLAAQGVTSGPAADWMREGLLNAEGEDHLRLRRLVSKAFTPRAINGMQPLMRAAAHRLIDEFAALGQCEFMSAFADRYPAVVIFELLGIPAELHGPCAEWVADLGLIFSWTAGANVGRIEAALARLDEVTGELIAARRRQPGTDLISALIAAEEAGDALNEHELRNMISALLFASQDTTRNQLGLALATFARHPAQWALLADDPSLGPAAVEEVMRVNPATPFIPRVADTDIDYQDLHAPTGTLITILVAAAHTDPRLFSPGFDITATHPARQLSFGGGPHTCLGMGLARLEMGTALPILAQRLGPITLDGPPTYQPPTAIYGPITLQLRFRR